MQHLCNDKHAVYGVVFHCDRPAGHNGDHNTERGNVTWFQREPGGARWTRRCPGAFLWHRIETRTRTACGVAIADLAPRTIRGRTLPVPPADALVCPSCLSMAPRQDDETLAVAA